MPSANSQAGNNARQPEHLQATLGMWQPLPPTFTTSPPPPPVEQEPVDMSRLREMVDDDPECLRAVVDMYLAESSELMERLRAAIREGSAVQTEWAAHKLGGSSATCGMVGVVDSLRRLERSGREGLVRAEDARWLQEADRQHRRVCEYLTAHVPAN